MAGGQKPLEIHDGILSADRFGQLTEFLSWVPMYVLKRTDRDPAADPLDIYWYYPIAVVEDKINGDASLVLDSLDDSFSLVREAWAAVRQRIGPNLRLYECELTTNAYGTEGHAHNDWPEPTERHNHLTAIIYCNTEWSIDWAGETIVFDDQGEIVSAVLPRPNRMTVLNGDLKHVARGVSRKCPQARRVLVFKMWRFQ